ncbi:MAG: hypothetical protein CL970_04460 [Euryarchaeota archaeon]|jgi:hypothetical protein|nr:hypothetical protein [Euryarchaeota archaeon]|tara:strand:- start:261 stop:710 length:450 start_codon:yes stop_codon:yes gene_type:complete
MAQTSKFNVKSISCIAEALLTSVIAVDANEEDSMDHIEKLSNFSKEALIGEVLKTWDALADAEASMSDMLFKIKRLELEITKISAVRGVSSTKIEMSERIKELEDMVRVQGKDASNNEVAKLESRVKVLLAALLDLEREVSSIKGDGVN